MAYATVNDLIALWRPLSSAEQTLAASLLDIVSAEIRQRAEATGRNFDDMIEDSDNLAVLAKSVCCDVVRRYMNDIGTDSPAMSQLTQSAGGYSVSGTFLVPGGGLFLKENELKRLGLKRQRFGVIEWA